MLNEIFLSSRINSVAGWEALKILYAYEACTKQSEIKLHTHKAFLFSIEAKLGSSCSFGIFERSWIFKILICQPHHFNRELTVVKWYPQKPWYAREMLIINFIVLQYLKQCPTSHSCWKCLSLSRILLLGHWFLFIY